MLSEMSKGPITHLKSQEDVSRLLQSVYDQISTKTEAVKSYAEALSTLRTGKADKAFIGDYSEANKMVYCLADTFADDEKPIEVVHGRTVIKYSLTNKRLMTGYQMFTAALKRAESEIQQQRDPGYILTEAEMEVLRGRLRGDQNRRSDVKSQNATVIMIILGKLDISFHENLLSASKHFRSGIENNCLLSLIEGLRNFVANPNAEISPDAGNDNREKAEINLKMLQLSIPVQLNHYRMKALLLSHIENVKRTSSVLSDSDIMRIIVKKLDQENIFRNIESNWSLDSRYSSCSSLELFWKILESDFNVFASTERGKLFLSQWREDEMDTQVIDQQQQQVNLISMSTNKNNLGGASGGSAILSNSMRKFEELQKCHNHFNYIMGNSKDPCARGNDCKFAHIFIDSRSNQDKRPRESELFMKAKRAFDRVDTQKPSKEHAKKIFKQLKTQQADNAKTAKTSASKSVFFTDDMNDTDDFSNSSLSNVAIDGSKNFDESEFEAFYVEFMKDEKSAPSSSNFSNDN